MKIRPVPLSSRIATLILFTFAVMLASPCPAQVATGTPRFGTFAGKMPTPPREVGGSQTPNASPSGPLAGGPDIINLGNLNAHLAIPILQKAGRGMPFSFYLSYDSSIWQPVGSSGSQTWQTNGNSLSGWTTSIPQAGYVSYTVTSHLMRCFDPDTGLQYFETVYYYNDWQYYDGLGTPHPFIAETQSDTDCGGDPSSDTATSSDGSGYTVSLTGNTVNSLTAVDGAIINPATGTLTLQDRNGNQITSTTSSGTTTYTDTLGTAAVKVTGTNPVTYTYTAPSGASASYTVKYSSYTVRTNFGCSGISEFGPTSENLVSEIDLPDNGSVAGGDKYTFSYESTPGYSGDVTGRLASVTFPTGGTISYSYTGGSNGIECGDGSTAGMSRQTPDGTWSYSRSGSGKQWTTTITDPQGNQTVIQFQEATNATNFFETERQVYQGSASGGTLLQTVNTCYNGASSPCNSTAITLPISSATVLDTLGSEQCKHFYSYNSYGLITEVDDYDYGNGAPGSLLRKQLVSYASLGNNIFDAPSQITVENSGGAVIAQTNVNYDGGSIVATSGTPQHVSISGSRGNPTSISYLVAGSSTLTRSFTYFDTGNVDVSTDVNNAQTTSNYANATSTCGNAFPTSISEPLSLSRSMAWNCTGGVEVSATDENGQTVSTTWNDAYYWRPAASADQENNVTNFYYQPNASYASPPEIMRSMTFNGGNSIVSDIQYMDTLGRTYTDQHVEAPGSSTLDSISYSYDSDGRLASMSGPCAVGWTGTCSGPATTQTYDALNRPLLTTDGGGGTVTLSYSANDVLQTIGPAPNGENTKRRQLEYNSLGELTSVCEISGLSGSGICGQTTSATGYWTEYTYDGAGRLTGVSQNAQSSQVQTRSFAYDGLGRMTSETNPETGTINYVYDSDATCGTSKGDLVKKTDAAGNTSCFAYDQLHRTTSITYPSGPNSGNTPGKYFVYDAATVNGNAMANAKARLAEAYTANCQTCSKITDEGFSYTVRGEVSDEYESTPHSNGYYHAAATYWANGVINSLTGPATYATNYNLDGEGRIYSAGPGGNQLASTTYNPASEPSIVTFASLDNDSFTYDPNTFRMTQYKFTVGASPQSVIGNLTWNSDGTLGSLNISDPFNAANTQNCAYSYDDLARIASGNCGSVWSQTFSYDAFGNITKTGNSQFQPGYNWQTNQMSSGASYDSNGDVLSDSLHSYAWDVETRPTTIDSVSVTYDALGRMVEQNNSGSYTEIEYSPTGFKMQLLNGQSWDKQFVPLPGGTAEVWQASGASPYYIHADWLGSSRFASTASRTMYNDLAFAPFGEQYAAVGTTGVTNTSFAGNNEDTTTNLYDAYFREYGIQGRWPSPDPAGIAAANPANPQSWNRYAYVLNNPLSLVDPLGLQTNPCGIALTCTVYTGDTDLWNPITGWGGGGWSDSALPLMFAGGNIGGGGTPSRLQQVQTAKLALANALANDPNCLGFLGQLGEGPGPLSALSTVPTILSTAVTDNNVGAWTTSSQSLTSVGPMPVSAFISINNNSMSSFFTPGYSSPVPGFVSGSTGFQAVELLHELGHVMGVLAPDMNGPNATANQVQNNNSLQKNCSMTISALGSGT